jgi:DNA-binding MarR family transcriptional regulator
MTPRASASALTQQPSEEVQALMETSKLVSAAIAHSLAVADAKVTLPQLRVLVMVRDQEPMNLSAVADALGVNPSNASRTCDRLVQSGLLDRREDPHDRRNVVLTLTPSGTQLVQSMLNQRQSIFAQVVDRMRAKDRSQLLSGLSALNQAAHELSTEGAGLPDGEGHLLRWLN